MHILLVLYFLGAIALSFAYLRFRRCTISEYIAWGTLACILPVLGPFLVIASRPGPKKR